MVDFKTHLCYYPAVKTNGKVYCIRLLGNRSFLLTGKHLILIDTGFPLQAKRIIKYIISLGLQPEALSLIILTHHHIDHMGSARQLKTLTGAKIAAHTYDIPYIEGKIHSFREHKTWWVKLLLFVTELLFRKEKVRVDMALHDGDRIDGLDIYHTPGHTKGSISIFLREEKYLFCGDTVPYTLGKLKRPNPYTLDHKKELQSLKTLSQLDFDILFPSDCRMVLNQARNLLISFCNKQ